LIQQLAFPNPALYSDKPKPGYTVRVAENLYLKNEWQDTMLSRIIKSAPPKLGKYSYSDNDFIFLGKIVEQLTGMTLDQYTRKSFYSKLGLETTGFKPRERFAVNRIIPTEEEKYFASNCFGEMFMMKEHQCLVAWRGMPVYFLMRMILQCFIKCC
jgi:hypothetical protein